MDEESKQQAMLAVMEAVEALNVVIPALKATIETDLDQLTEEKWEQVRAFLPFVVEILESMVQGSVFSPVVFDDDELIDNMKEHIDRKK